MRHNTKALQFLCQADLLALFAYKSEARALLVTWHGITEQSQLYRESGEQMRLYLAEPWIMHF